IRDLIWQRANCLIWLDYSFPVIFRRLIARTWRRIVAAEKCCNGNRESFWRTFSRDSILWWAITTYSRRRREYAPLLEVQARAGKSVFVHTRPIETDAWLRQLAEVSCRDSDASTTII